MQQHEQQQYEQQYEQQRAEHDTTPRTADAMNAFAEFIDNEAEDIYDEEVLYDEEVIYDEQVRL